jgi:hypothetical protein
MWALVENNEIVTTAFMPPRTLSDGRTRSNVHKKPPEGWVVVVDNGPPEYDKEKEWPERGGIVLVEGVPIRNWVIRTLEQVDA